MRMLMCSGVIAAVFSIAGCTPPAEKAADYVTDGRLFLDAGDYTSAKLELKNALQIQPRNAEARYLMALINEERDNPEEAIGNLQIAVEADPGYVDAHVKLGMYYSYGKLAEQTRKHAEAALNLAPERGDVRLLQARSLYLQGDADAALGEVRAALSAEPDRLEAITFASALHAERGDIDAAVSEIAAGLDASDDTEDREALRRARIELLRVSGRENEVEAELRQLVTEYPESPEYPIALVRLYLSDNRQADAEALVRELIANDPDNAEWRIQLAGLLYAREQAGDAEASLRAAIAENPDSAPLKLALGGYLESEERLDDARTVYGEVAGDKPLSEGGLAARNRIAASYIGDDDDRARNLINAILKDAPDNVEALLSRAAFAFQREQYGEAITDTQLALAKQTTSERALLLLARSYLRAAEPALAEDTYRQLVTLNPSNRAANNELAVLIGNRGSTEEAEQLLRETLSRAPGDSGASRNLVKALLQQEKFSEAETEARRIIDLGENTGLAEFQLAEALEAQGDFDGAIAAYRESLQRNPTAQPPLSRLVSLLVKIDRAPEAETLLIEQIDRFPDDVFARLLLADTQRISNEMAASRDTLNAVAERWPAEAGAYIGLAALETPGSEARVDVLRKGLEMQPADIRLILALGTAHKARGEFDRAIEVYETAVKNGADSEFVVNNLVSLLLDQRDDDASHARALELASRFRDSNNPLQLGVLGWAYHRAGDDAQAVIHLERAVAGASGNPLLHYYLGTAYLGQQDESNARTHLQSALDIADRAGGTFVGIDDAQAKLDALGKGG